MHDFHFGIFPYCRPAFRVPVSLLGVGTRTFQTATRLGYIQHKAKAPDSASPKPVFHPLPFLRQVPAWLLASQTASRAVCSTYCCFYLQETTDQTSRERPRAARREVVVVVKDDHAGSPKSIRERLNSVRGTYSDVLSWIEAGGVLQA